MIESLKKLEKYDLKNLKGDKLESCIARIINTLLILDRKVDIIYEIFEGEKDD